MIIKIKELTENISLLEQNVTLTPDQIKKSRVNGDVVTRAVVSYLSDKVYLEISFNCHLDQICDRCTKPFKQEISGKTKLFLQDKELSDGDDFDGDVIYYDQSDDEVDLRELIYEEILLETPIMSLCNKECKGFKKEDTKSNKEEWIDPRWDVLRKLKDKK